MPNKFVRVKDPDTKHEYSVTETFAKANKLDVLSDKEAVDENGRPLPGKPHAELAKANGGRDGADDSPPSLPSTTSSAKGGNSR